MEKARRQRLSGQIHPHLRPLSAASESGAGEEFHRLVQTRDQDGRRPGPQSRHRHRPTARPRERLAGEHQTQCERSLRLRDARGDGS